MTAASRQDQRKQAVAQAALAHLPRGGIIGVGTGSTVNFLIDLLPQLQLKGAVPSSRATEERLKKHGIDVLTLGEVTHLDVYIDGADEINAQGQMIKGGGGALTQEKIVASVADRFICIVDSSKCVEQLGAAFPLPIEVIAMARSVIARKLVALGGNPVYRQGVVTDNGHVILDVHGLAITDALALESEINQWPGVVCNGIFAHQAASTVLIAGEHGVAVRG